MSCVYFIRKGGENIFKIGKANENWRDRFINIQVGNESKLFLCALIHCSNSFDIEAELHQVFRNFQLYGEWFCISWNDVVRVLNQYQSVYQIEVFNNELEASQQYINRAAPDIELHQRLLNRLKELETAVLFVEIYKQLAEEAYQECSRLQDQLMVAEREILTFGSSSKYCLFAPVRLRPIPFSSVFGPDKFPRK